MATKSNQTAADTPSDSTSKATERTPDEDGVREHAIREAAYRRFEARGDTPGDERQDWLDAQAEVDGRAG